MYECNAIEEKKHTHTHSSVAEKVIQTLQDPLLIYTTRSTLSHTHKHTHRLLITSLCLYMSGPLTSKEELEVNYRSLSRALKQLQLKPESPHRKGGMERIQGGEMERGINHGYGESDFRMQKWGENRWGEGDAGTELQGNRQWWRASRRSGTTTLDISLPLCMSRGWRCAFTFFFLIFYFPQPLYS